MSTVQVHPIDLVRQLFLAEARAVGAAPRASLDLELSYSAHSALLVGIRISRAGSVSSFMSSHAATKFQMPIPEADGLTAEQACQINSDAAKHRRLHRQEVHGRR